MPARIHLISLNTPFGTSYISFLCSSGTWYEDAAKPLRRVGTFPNWATLVTDYSHKMLTFKTDKLPALSGLAHEYQKTLRDRYLAGLWEIDLPAALCWSTVRNKQRLPKAYAEYIASWIWASVDGHVRFISDRPWDCETLPGCEVKSVQVAPLGKDPMGRVRSGRLVISAPIRRARCRRKGD